MRINLIGCGTMGEAILKAIIRKKICSNQEITVCEMLSDRRNRLGKKYGVTTTGDCKAFLDRADVVILAVKPQDVESVLQQITGLFKAQLFISIAAGIKLDYLCTKLNYNQVVRSMPNTPARIGKGMTVWTGTVELETKNREKARMILSSFGEELYFSDEKYLDMATALSGSGPAYIFLFIEALIDAGVHIGLSRDISQKLVLQTISGSVEMMEKLSKHPAELRNMVTSPAGTTTVALLQMESGGLRSLIITAVEAAYQKAKQLSSK